MSLAARAIRSAHVWAQDRLLRRVLRNSSFLLLGNVFNAVMSIVTANLLGAQGLGVLGAIIAFVSNVNRLLSFRMGEAVVRYVGGNLARGDKTRAAAAVKVLGLTEAVTSLAAYGALALLAPWGARTFAHDAGATQLFLMYGVSILANLTTETANGILQVGNHYRTQALINFAQSLLTAALIAAGAVMKAGLTWILMAYLAGKIILGLSPIVMAFIWLPRMLGAGWWRAPISLLPERRKMARFALSTNFSGTISMLARDSEVLWVNYFFSPLEGGYFRIAQVLINLVVMPVTPFISTTYPEITRFITTRQWPHLRSLLKRVTLIAGAWTGGVTLVLVLLGRQLLFSPWSLFGKTFYIYRADLQPGFWVLLILLAGYGVANTWFWNRSLLLGFGLADFALWVGFAGMLLKSGLGFLLVPAGGYLAEAGLLSAYLGGTVAVLTWRGLRALSRAEREP